MRRPAPIATLAAALLCLAACTPTINLNIDVLPSRGPVREAVVYQDEGADQRSAKVALIHVRGFIADAPAPGLLGAAAAPTDDLVARLRKAADDDGVRALVVRITSPGGSVTGSDVMCREIERFRERTGKPVVAAIGEIGTSGGYYTALAADEIFAEPTSLTGSIGVIFQTFNVSGTMAKLGVTGRAITSGPNKDLLNPFEPPRDEHYEITQTIVDEAYLGFVERVRERRTELSDEDAEWATDGRVMSGESAHEVGLIDHLGGVREAYERAKELAKIKTARMVAYSSGRTGPRTVYGASADAIAGGGVTVNLVEVTVPDLGLLPPGLHYVWRGGLGG